MRRGAQRSGCVYLGSLRLDLPSASEGAVDFPHDSMVRGVWFIKAVVLNSVFVGSVWREWGLAFYLRVAMVLRLEM